MAANVLGLESTDDCRTLLWRHSFCSLSRMLDRRDLFSLIPSMVPLYSIDLRLSGPPLVNYLSSMPWVWTTFTKSLSTVAAAAYNSLSSSLGQPLRIFSSKLA